MTEPLLEALSLLGDFDHRRLAGVADFHERGGLVVALNALIGPPSVVVGVLVSISCFRSAARSAPTACCSRRRRGPFCKENYIGALHDR